MLLLLSAGPAPFYVVLCCCCFICEWIFTAAHTMCKLWLNPVYAPLSLTQILKVVSSCCKSPAGRKHVSLRGLMPTWLREKNNKCRDGEGTGGEDLCFITCAVDQVRDIKLRHQTLWQRSYFIRVVWRWTTRVYPTRWSLSLKSSFIFAQILQVCFHLIVCKMSHIRPLKNSTGDYDKYLEYFHSQSNLL